MKTRIAPLALLAAAAMLSSGADAIAKPGQLPGKPRFIVLPNNAPGHVAPVHPAGAPAVQLSQWNGSFKDKTGNKITFTMVGPNPANHNNTTTIPVVLIPIKVVFGLDNGATTFDPKTHLVGSTGKNVVAMTLASPVFKSNVAFKSGTVALGKTQYIDAYQRGNFWKSLQTNSNIDYHVLLGTPTVLKEQTIKVSPTQGELITDGTVTFGMVDISYWDSKLQSFMAKFAEVNPGVLPLFLSEDVFLAQGVNVATCCIGGYHSANGSQPAGQTYAYTTFVDEPGQFAQDVSALSHEIGEWMDDPFVNNFVNCTDNNILENGDPLEGDQNFGAYPFAVRGYTYNLQSLVFLPYFGAPKATSVNSWFSLNGTPSQNPASHDSVSGVCPGPQ